MKHFIKKIENVKFVLLCNLLYKYKCLRHHRFSCYQYDFNVMFRIYYPSQLKNLLQLKLKEYKK